MNITFLAAECAPFVKVGGLGDVIGTLPTTMAKLGHNVAVMIPHHGLIDDQLHQIHHSDSFTLEWGGTETVVDVALITKSGVNYYFIRGWPYFSPDDNFVYHDNEGIDVGRYLFFTASAIELSIRLAHQSGQRPDVFHSNDWHTAGVAYLLREVYAKDPLLAGTASLFTIHNMQYQGWGVGWHLESVGLPPIHSSLLKSAGKADSLLAVGLAYSNLLTTVSPRYALEIASPDGGFDLDSIIHARSASLVGILNGIDYVRWNPAESGNLAQQFSTRTIGMRTKNKLALQSELKLEESAVKPVVGTVMRLVDQKGPALMLASIRSLMKRSDVQFILLGTGSEEYEKSAVQLGEDFAGRSSINVMFDEALSERIYGGIDMFLMPSEFEPCGIGQMIAMRYGAVPIVNSVGGLADTVDKATGFVMKDYSIGSLDAALANALNVYDHDPKGWRQRQLRGMKKDFSWEESAREYEQAYVRAIQRHQQYSTS